MCDQCRQIDERIRQAGRFTAAGYDSLTVERIEKLIQDLRRCKDELQCSK
jgi:hypothetical protein